MRGAKQFLGILIAVFIGLVVFAPIGGVVAAISAWQWRGAKSIRVLLVLVAVYVLIACFFAAKLVAGN